MTEQTPDGAADTAAPTSDDLWNEAQKGEDDASHHPEPDDAEDPPEIEGDDAPAAGQAENDDQDKDIWADVSPEVKAAYDEAIKARDDAAQRLKSNNGRVSAYQRKYEEAQAQLAALHKEPQPADDEEDDDDDEAIKSAEADYPEVVGPLLKHTKKLESRLAGIEAAAQRSRDEATESENRRYAAEYGKLDKEYPGFAQVMDENQAVYQAWLVQQSDDLREKAARNMAAIVDATEAADVVSRFLDFKGKIDGALTEPSGEKSDTPQTARDGKRARQLQGAASASSSPQTGASGGIPKNADPSAIWDEAERRDQAKRNPREFS